MSFLPISEENKEAPAGQTTNAPAPPAAGGSAGAAPEAPKGATSGSPTQFGSSASKLSDYLSANAPQITQQAETLAGTLGQQYGNLSQGIQNVAGQFGQAVQGGYAAPNPDVVSQAMQNPAGFAQSPENVQAFQKQYGNQYTGPLSFEGFSPYSDIQGQVGQAVQQGNLLQSPAGLLSYLRGQGPNPTRASATLDALLMRGNPQAQETINQAAGQFANLPGQLSTATAGANQSVLDAQKAAEESRAAAQSAFTGKEQSFGQDLANRLAQMQGQYQGRTQQNADLLAALGQSASLVPEAIWTQNNLDPRLLQSLQGIRSYNVSNPAEALQIPLASNYLTPVEGGAPPTLANIATGEDAALANALAQLSGGAYQAPVTAEGYYSIPGYPTLQQSEMGNELYQILSGLTPSFTGASNPTAALQGYQTAKSNLQNYLGLPVTGPIQPVAPPPADQPPFVPPPPPPPGWKPGGPGIRPYDPSMG